MNRLLFTLLFFSLSALTNAQVDRCGTTKLMKMYPPKSVESTTQTSSIRNLKDSVIIIPVVVHIMKDPNDPMNVNSNISDEQVISQLKALNADFRKENPDVVKTIAAYQNRSGDAKMIFALAKKDPSGNPTTGILRVNYPNSYFHSMSDDQAMKAVSSWPPDRYLNIWVVGNMPDGTLGYCYLPSMVIDSAFRDKVDGLVCGAKYFGSLRYKSAGNNFYLDNTLNLGRTSTHELGHFFGLYHPWGDTGGCWSTDSVYDTPVSSNPLFGCPGHPSDCNETRMSENYMDYTNDSCMFMFSKGQVERMRFSMVHYAFRFALADSQNVINAGLNPYFADSMAIVEGDNQRCFPEKSPSNPLVVKVYNNLGSEFQGQQVSIGIKSIPANASLIYSDQQTSDVDGLVKFNLLAGSEIGTYQFNILSSTVKVDTLIATLNAGSGKSKTTYTLKSNPGDDLELNVEPPYRIRPNIQIFDAMGRLVYNKSFSEVGNTTISLPFMSFSAGVYVIHITDETGTFDIKAVKR